MGFIIGLNINQPIMQKQPINKRGKSKGCVTTEIQNFGSTPPVASTFKPKSIKVVAFRTMQVFWGCVNGNSAAYLQFSKPIFCAFRFYQPRSGMVKQRVKFLFNRVNRSGLFSFMFCEGQW